MRTTVKRRYTIEAWRERRKLQRPPGSFVYFIECAEAFAIKIGFTSSVARRFSMLQTSSPFELKLLVTVPGGVEHEARLHWLFQRERIRGEWFRDGGGLRSMVDALMRLPEASRTELVEREPSMPQNICRPEAEREAREEIEQLLISVADEFGVMAACELYRKVGERRLPNARRRASST